MTEIIAPMIPVTKMAVSACCLIAIATKAQAIVKGYKILSNPRRTATAKNVATAINAQAIITEIESGDLMPT